MFNALLDGGAGAVSQYNRCIGVWPEAEACALKGLVGLAQCCDRSLRRYLTGHDAFMCRGPYNYARVRALTKHSRAREFCAAVARLGPPAERPPAPAGAREFVLPKKVWGVQTFFHAQAAH